MENSYKTILDELGKTNIAKLRILTDNFLKNTEDSGALDNNYEDDENFEKQGNASPYKRN